MKKERKPGKKGFTIIEVVLVLAIAGLIFLMVFVALPALQRSQRDTQRRQDYGDLLAAVISYTTNNNGNLPAEGATNLYSDEYINKTGKGPSGSPYGTKITTASGDEYYITVCAPGGTTKACVEPKGASNTSEGDVQIAIGAECGAATGSTVGVKKSTVPTAFAVYADLESGSYCVNSNQ